MEMEHMIRREHIKSNGAIAIINYNPRRVKIRR